MVVSLQGLAALCVRFRRFQKLVLVPSPSLLSGSVSRVASGPRRAGGCFPLCLGCSCFWLDHRTLSCQSSCGYPEQEEFPRMP